LIRVLVLLAMIALAGCSGHTLTESHGPLFPLNAGQWEPTPDDLKAP
jgi:Outer membrane lipoprotein virB7